MDAWHIFASTNYKVSISVIIVDAVPKSIRYLLPLKPAIMIPMHVSAIPFLFQWPNVRFF